MNAGLSGLWRSQAGVRYARTMRLWLCILGLGVALANPYAALVITPYGEQIFDLATGVTTLPQGGEVIDRDGKVVLAGQQLRYRQGVFVEALSARVEAEAFVLIAENIYLDVPAQRLDAEGEVSFESPELGLMAERLSIDLVREQAVLNEVVSTREPLLAAATLVVVSDLSAALLVGPYRYQDGPLTLSSSEAGDLLELRWVAGEAGFSFTVTTEISEELLARYAPD